MAIVGASGSGKSTVLGLLARFYDPDRGVVAFDGSDIRAASFDSLRGQLGIVPGQLPVQHDGPREHPHGPAERHRRGGRDGRPRGRDPRPHRRPARGLQHTSSASAAAGCPAVNVSAWRSPGRSSAIPQILLLDEATSALDPTTEAAINGTLERLGRDRTVIGVTHRLASTRLADLILGVRQGPPGRAGQPDASFSRSTACTAGWRNKQQGLVVSEDGTRAEVEPDRLRAIPILSTLSDTMLAAVARTFLSERFTEGRPVILEGDTTVEKFYIVARGKVAVLKRQEDGTDKQIATLQEGDYFGEVALLRDAPRNATIRTLTPCILLTLQRRQFLRADPERPAAQPPNSTRWSAARVHPVTMA